MVEKEEIEDRGSLTFRALMSVLMGTHQSFIQRYTENIKEILDGSKEETRQELTDGFLSSDLADHVRLARMGNRKCLYRSQSGHRQIIWNG